MRRITLGLGLLLALAACSEDDRSFNDPGASGGSAGSSTGGSAGSSTGGSAGSSTGGSAGSSTGGSAGTGGSATGGSAGASTGGAGGMAGSGSGGMANGGMGGMSDPCTDCLTQHCQSALTKCQNNSECLAVQQCAENCTDLPCVAACGQQHPNGATDFNTLFACLGMYCAMVCQ